MNTIVAINRLYVKTRTATTCTSDEYFESFGAKVQEYLDKGFKPFKIERNNEGKVIEVVMMRPE